MAATIFYDKDADLAALKNKTIAIIGYGSQGHAQAQNLRDSGLNVVIGQRPGSPNYDLAVSHGFKPMSAAEATKAADVVNILLPDEVQGDVYRNDIRPNLKKGAILMCSHGFNIHFGRIVPPGAKYYSAEVPASRRLPPVPCLTACWDRTRFPCRSPAAIPCRRDRPS